MKKKSIKQKKVAPPFFQHNKIFARIAVIIFLTFIDFIIGFYLQVPNAHYHTTRPTQMASLQVVGKRIVDSNGNTFVPYGVQLVGCGMADAKFTTTHNWKQGYASTYLTPDIVQAAHDFWHANTVSLQLSANALFTSSPYDQSYLAYDKSYLARVDNVVTWTKALNMNLVLVLQDECPGNPGNSMPTQKAVKFWTILSQHYASSMNIFFDIYNEPDVNTLVGHSDDDASWNFWQNGGTGVQDGLTYVGMQQLVNVIRNNGFKNLIFVDGLASGGDIVLLPKHTLTGTNIVYAVHPYFGRRSITRAQWDHWFGNAARTGNFPVVADEWNVYADRTNCSYITTELPRVQPFFSYLKSLNIGLIGYALLPGTLIRGWDFRNPTAFDQVSHCSPNPPSPDFDSLAQGAGQLLQQYLATNSKQQPLLGISPGEPVTLSPIISPSPISQ